MRIEVVRAWRDRFEREALALAPGATVGDALRAATIDQAGVAGYAIHGERVAADAVLREGDRLELLDPLLADPKDSRRRRASAQAERKRGP